jgi:hypothetical protein
LKIGKLKIISSIIKIRNSRKNTIPSAPIRRVIKERSNKIHKKFTKEELERLEIGAPDKKEYFGSSYAGGLKYLISKRPVSFMTEMCKIKRKKSENRTCSFGTISINRRRCDDDNVR